MFPAKCMVVIPVIVFRDSSEMQEVFSPFLGPAHACVFKTILDQMAASAFDDPGGDRPTLGEIFVVVHAPEIALKVIGSHVQLFLLGFGCARSLRQAT